MENKIQILRHSEMVKKLGISRSTLYAMRNPRSPYYDPTLPEPIRLSKATVGFFEHEVEAWLLKRVSYRR
ncbi:AlpA family phage regulatory protein [Xanthomonas bromi]